MRPDIFSVISWEIRPLAALYRPHKKKCFIGMRSRSSLSVITGGGMLMHFRPFQGTFSLILRKGYCAISECMTTVSENYIVAPNTWNIICLFFLILRYQYWTFIYCSAMSNNLKIKIVDNLNLFFSHFVDSVFIKFLSQ